MREAVRILMESPIYLNFPPVIRLQMVKEYYHSHLQ